VFAPGRPFQARLRFTIKVKAYPHVAPEICSTMWYFTDPCPQTFVLVKYNSKATEAREKISTALEYLKIQEIAAMQT